MTTNFVSFYLIIVLITGPFFQFLPMPVENLLWDEILLAKILNQAPTIFLLVYLLFQTKKLKHYDIFIVLIAFLAACIVSEIYYYFVSPQVLLIFSIAHNTLTYFILIILLLRRKIAFKDLEKNVLLMAILLSGLVVLGFSFSAYGIYEEYFSSDITNFFISILFIISAVLVVFFSFFTEKPFQRNWYEVVIGIFLLVVVDIYTYSCFFVFNSAPTLLYTIGKVLFSTGVLLLVDGILRKKIKGETSLYAV